ncbi:MAG TPA: glycosyltransferase family 2 protein, partial [Anaeromyxobacter sp.]|nr:glycosyltransferase family 2 protein [Anaeromyxobacter sp.]
MTTPLVSIVTPSFNYAAFLPACVASVRAQHYARIEHLVQDGGSTDGTAELLARLAAEAPLDYRVERDAGQADAINRGFVRARGEILAWLNADDFYLGPDVVAEAVEALADPAVDVVTAGGRYVDASGAPQGDIAAPHDLARTLRYFDPVLQPATFWKRRVHRPARTDCHFTFDWRLFLDMAAAGARFDVRDRQWAAYRMHGVNKTAADPARRRLEIADVLREQFGP